MALPPILRIKRPQGISKAPHVSSDGVRGIADDRDLSLDEEQPIEKLRKTITVVLP